MIGELCRKYDPIKDKSQEKIISLKDMIYQGVSRMVFFIGIVVIGILAVPAGILFLLICGIWSGVDYFTAKLGSKQKNRKN